DARARVQRDVLGGVEGLEAALFRVAGHRDHLVRVGAEETGVVHEPEFHVRNLPAVEKGGVGGWEAASSRSWPSTGRKQAGCASSWPGCRRWSPSRSAGISARTPWTRCTPRRSPST